MINRSNDQKLHLPNASSNSKSSVGRYIRLFHHKLASKKTVSAAFIVTVVASGIIGLVVSRDPLAAVCSATENESAVATADVHVPADETYRVWSRVMVPEAENNSFYLDVGDQHCGIVVGGAQVEPDTWVWVDYRDGVSEDKLDLALDQGEQTVRMAGREDGVKVDRLVFTTDTGCVPEADGSNCADVSTALVGDINNDNTIDIFDLSLLLSSWGTDDTDADLNTDGTVDVFDLSLLLSNWSNE